MKKIEIINASVKEEEFIRETFELIAERYSGKVKFSNLESVEVVDELSGDSSGRAIRRKLFLSRKNGLELLNGLNYDEINDDRLKDMIATIYHELWHVPTYDKYQNMYETVLDDQTDIYLALAYRYWIEYIAHMHTGFMEVTENMKNFCDSFVKEEWQDTPENLLKLHIYLPYYIARAQILGRFEKDIKKIKSEKLRAIVCRIKKKSCELMKNKSMSEQQKALVIRDEIRKIWKETGFEDYLKDLEK